MIAQADAITFALAIRTGRGGNDREGHWGGRAKGVKALRSETRLQFLVHVPMNFRTDMGRAGPLLPCTVKLTRIAPSDGLDDDNLRGALKAARDEMAVLLGLPVTRRGQADDRDPRVSWEYDQRRGKWGVEIEIRRRSSK